MAAINTNNPNVAYNYQKYPNLIASNSVQSKTGLVLALRDKANTNRNAMFLFPNKLSTPNYGAGSPTLLASTDSPIIGNIEPYAGYQVT